MDKIRVVWYNMRHETQAIYAHYCYGQNKSVGVKAKPECCREQNRNTGNGPVKRASAIDNASFVLFSCSYRIPRPPWGADRPVLRAKPEKVYTITHETTNR